jgi:hypothetical protein
VSPEYPHGHGFIAATIVQRAVPEEWFLASVIRG